MRDLFLPSFDSEGIHITSRDQLSLRFDEPWSFEQVQELVIDLQWLLTLAAGSPVPTTKFTYLSSDWQEEGDKTRKSIEVFMRWPGWKTSRRKLHRSQLLFTAAAFSDGLGPALARWRAYRQKHDAVLSCYFSTVFNEYLYDNHRFLFLAHALELYHQINFDGAYQEPADFKARLDNIAAAVPGEADWLRDRLAGANRKTLADRLRELVVAKQSLLGGLVPDTEKFVQRVKDTRNYYTHYDEGLRRNGRVAEGAELYGITETMRILIEMCFLQDLGISLAAIYATQLKNRGRGSAPDFRQFIFFDVNFGGFDFGGLRLGGSRGLFRHDFSVDVFGRSFLIGHRQEPVDGDAEQFLVLLEIGPNQLPVRLGDLSELTAIELLFDQLSVGVPHINRSAGGQGENIRSRVRRFKFPDRSIVITEAEAVQHDKSAALERITGHE